MKWTKEEIAQEFDSRVTADRLLVANHPKLLIGVIADLVTEALVDDPHNHEKKLQSAMWRIADILQSCGHIEQFM
jgi:hypothetical protein